MPEAIAARLIGSLFVERGLVSESQIRVALQIQRETGEQLGQVLVDKFGVSRKELTRVVAEQWREMNADRGAGPDAAPGETWRPLGEIFVTRGFVSEDELDAALSRQRKTGERLGEALVALGVISKFELAGALGEQMATLQEAEDAERREANVVSLHRRSGEDEVQTFGVLDEVASDAQGEIESQVADGPSIEADLLALIIEQETKQLAEAEPLAEVESPAEVEPTAVAEAAIEAHVELEPEPALEPMVEPEPEPALEVEAQLETEVEEPVGSMNGVAAAPTVEPELVPDSGVGADGRPAIVAEPEPEPEPELDPAALVAYASTPKGYRLVPLSVELPAVGETIYVPEVGELVVARVGRSPLPLDKRLCVFVEQRLAAVDAPIPAYF